MREDSSLEGNWSKYLGCRNLQEQVKKVMPLPGVYTHEFLRSMNYLHSHNFRNSLCTLADSGFFKNFLYQGGVKSTVFWVYEDLKFISEGYDQNWCFFWNFKLKVLIYSRNCSLHATLIPNLVKPLMYTFKIEWYWRFFSINPIFFSGLFVLDENHSLMANAFEHQGKLLKNHQKSSRKSIWWFGWDS